MDKETLIKLLNKYFEKMGNKEFVRKYELDSENLPFKIWIDRIEDYDKLGRPIMFIKTSPRILSHSLSDENDDYVGFWDAVTWFVNEIIKNTLGIEDRWIKFVNNKGWVDSADLDDRTNPYEDDEIDESTKIRTFNQNIHENELKWHRDERDRKVKILEGRGWMLQIDNELPVVMEEGKEYFIPKEIFHRTIKGKGNLVVEIEELD